MEHKSVELPAFASIASKDDGRAVVITIADPGTFHLKIAKLADGTLVVDRLYYDQHPEPDNITPILPFKGVYQSVKHPERGTVEHASVKPRGTKP